MNSNESLRSEFDRLQQRALVIGGVGLALCLVGALRDPKQFFRSYLVGYLLWLGIALGCVALVMLHHLVGGNWGFVIRRILEAGARTLPLLVVLGIPFVISLSPSHAWARPEMLNLNSMSPFKRVYLGDTFFYVRTAVYFAAWLSLAYILNKWSFEQDQTDQPARVGIRLQSLSAPGLIIYGFTVTYAAVDWVMSLESAWFSTIYGMMFMVAQALSAMAFVIIVLMLLSRQKPLSDVVSASHFHDLGTLLLAFVMLWGYLLLSQYLIIWSGNLQEEITWYMSRGNGGWATIALFLVIFHFFVPFFLLLSRDVKRRMRVLATVAAGLIFVSWVDLIWIVKPSFKNAPPFHWLDVAAPIGVGGVWIAGFIWQLKDKPLLPLNDPEFSGGAGHAA
jgi:hypothetical protein